VQKCPKFNAECTNNGITYSNKDFIGKNLVSIFIPKIALQDALLKDKSLEIIISI